MKKINKLGILLIATIMAIGMAFTSCEPENITTDTYTFPDVYVALIKVTPTDIVALSDITIEGNDLDYVKAVRIWSDSSDVQIEIPKAEFLQHTKDSIVVNVPEDAPIGIDKSGIQTGRISVITSDDRVITWLNNVSDKPIVIAEVTPDTVAAGDIITLSGENFEYIKAVRFTKGDQSAIIAKDKFESFSAEENTLSLVVPEGAPVEKLSVITIFDQIVFWEGTLKERTLSVLEFSPQGIVVVGTDITVKVENIDLVKSIAFGTIETTYTATKEDSLLVIAIPNSIAEGKYALNINTWNGIIKVADFDIVRLYREYVWDWQHVYFDFETKGSWWGDCPQTVADDPAYAISGSYFHIKTTAVADWYGLFFRNAGDNLNVSGVTVDNWVVKYDINVLGDAITSFKIRLGDFWYVTSVNPNIGGWYTITAPLNEFKNNNGNGDPMTDADIAALASGGDFGFADGGTGGEYDVLIDNVRFESKTPCADPVADPAYVYFDFDAKGSWWGDCPQTVENDPDYSISGSYFHIEAIAAVGWYGLFWRNAGDGLNVSGVTVDNWAVKYDINVLGDNITSFKIRLGDFWYITSVNPNIGGWYTFMAPLSGFKNNNGEGDPMTDADIAALASGGDFGFADGGAGGEYNVLIDNVRFEQK